MTNPHNEATVSRKALRKRTTTIFKKKMNLWVLAALLLSSELVISLSYSRVKASSGTNTIYVEPSSRESITKLLQIGEKIVGKITVSGGDNYIIFKLYDPAGNPCLWRNVLQSSEFSWGPVNFDGEYLFVFDNWYDSSNRNTVNFEYQITYPLDNSFPTTIVAVIAVVLVTILGPLAIFSSRRAKKNRVFPSNELHNAHIVAIS